MLPLQPGAGDPSFRWDDGGGGVAASYLSLIERHLSAPCPPAKAEPRLGPRLCGETYCGSYSCLIQKGDHPGEGRGPIGGRSWLRASLRYCGHPNWAPASAGVVALLCVGAERGGGDLGTVGHRGRTHHASAASTPISFGKNPSCAVRSASNAMTSSRSGRSKIRRLPPVRPRGSASTSAAWAAPRKSSSE